MATTDQRCLDALRRVLDGNQRFASGHAVGPDTSPEKRASHLEVQRPFAAVVGCADARVPVEVILDQGIGDLFVVRVAGNTCPPPVIGSIEFAVARLEVALVAVIGHERCGAVEAALAGPADSEYLRKIMDEIRPAVDRARPADAGNILETATRLNAINTAERLKARSEILRSRVESGRLAIVPFFYSLDSGRLLRLP